MSGTIFPMIIVQLCFSRFKYSITWKSYVIIIGTYYISTGLNKKCVPWRVAVEARQIHRKQTTIMLILKKIPRFCDFGVFCRHFFLNADKKLL